MRGSPPRRYGFVLIDGYALMSMASAVEPLRAANLLSGRALFELTFLSADGGWQRSSVDSAFETLPLKAARPDFDVVFVVAGGEPMGYRDPRVLGWLRRLDRGGVALGGISGGAAILAAAGLLRARRFTIHWQHVDAMRARYPDALIERRLFVIDRDRFTCAGGMAPLDMMHALIAADFGAELARQVSDWFIHTGIRSAEAPQQLDATRKYELRHPALAAAVELMASHIADPLKLSDLAHLSGIGMRQLDRLAQAHFGKSAMRFYRGLRLEKAAELLRQPSLSLTEVAAATGFASPSHFSRAFKEEFGTGPGAWRQAGPPGR
ncbi:GlxA family transcriptional regulator [Paracoccus siganidrum]|uniref:GlxA family transcriptional regulator n=2 Tax=Paracoccus siganidrum TaxID=1276757 RepID=A0A419A512_9RHOB|nr:GlxA family transcriptional regulator [Paracoccus siganidrum]RMC28982.1 GlxA family transcriptional regulator [Paracoccus siganidrum]